MKTNGNETHTHRKDLKISSLTIKTRELNNGPSAQTRWKVMVKRSSDCDMETKTEGKTKNETKLQL